MSTSTEEGKKEGFPETATEGETNNEVSKSTRNLIKEGAERLVEELAPQPEPLNMKQMRFTVICGSKKLLADHDQRDIAAVHILAIDQESAKFSARQLLGANVKDTTADDWDAVIAYLGFQEIL